MPVIKDAVFAYCKIDQADFKYGSKTEKEYSVDVVVPKAVAKEWNKKYQKQKCKEVDRDDFERAYKFAPPFEGDELYVIKLKKPAQYKDGTPIADYAKPRVLLATEDGNVDITATTKVANGSKGVAQFDEVSNDFGTFAKLKAIRVDELIEYKPAGGGASFDELGGVKGGLADLGGIPEREPSEAQEKAYEEATKETSKPKAKKEVVQEEVDPFGDELDAPF